MTGPQGREPHGTNATLAALRAAYPNAEAFAWAGVMGDGASTVTGQVVKVNGQPAAASVKVSADGTASAR